MPTQNFSNQNNFNLSDAGVSEDAVKHWISELTDFTPQQIDAVLARRQRQFSTPQRRELSQV